jgi:toxin CcdB
MVTRQFDVFKNPRDKARFPFLLLVQHEILSGLPVRMVVPMTPLKVFGARPVSRLNPVFQVNRQAVVMLTQMMGAVATSSLERRVTSLATKRAEIIAAIDILFSGV